MSFQAMTWATEQELPAMQKIVLLMMANRTNHDTGLCFPSHETLAKECGMTTRSVINQINILSEQDLLSVIHTFGDDGRKRNNHYRLHLDKSAKKPSTVKMDVNDVHLPSESLSPTLVNDVHLPSESLSHKPVIITSNIKPEIKPKDNSLSSEREETTKNSREFPKNLERELPPPSAQCPTIDKEVETLTAEDVVKYLAALTIILPIDDAQMFINRYASQGWFVNGNPIADWRAKAREWCGRGKKYQENEKQNEAAKNPVTRNKNQVDKHSKFTQPDYYAGMNDDGSF